MPPLSADVSVRSLPPEFRVTFSFFGVIAALLFGLQTGSIVAKQLTTVLAQVPPATLATLGAPAIHTIIVASWLEAAMLAGWAISWSLTEGTLRWWRLGTRSLGLFLLLWLAPWVFFVRTMQEVAAAQGVAAQPGLASAILWLYGGSVLLQIFSMLRALSTARSSKG